MFSEKSNEVLKKVLNGAPKKYRTIKANKNPFIQDKSYATNYVTTIVFHLGDSGCHVIYTKEKVDKIPVEEYWTRLWGETERSVEVALYLRAQEIEINTIGLDFNSDPNRKSNKLVKASIGYVESFGFKARIKPDILPAISAADGLAR